MKNIHFRRKTFKKSYSVERSLSSTNKNSSIQFVSFISSSLLPKSFSLINFGCEATDARNLSKLNHCTSQEPKGEKARKKVLDLDAAGKIPENYSRGKPMQSGRDCKPNPFSNPDGIWTGDPEVEDEARYHSTFHYGILTLICAFKHPIEMSPKSFSLVQYGEF